MATIDLHTDVPGRGTPLLGLRESIGLVQWDAVSPKAFEVYFEAEHDTISFCLSSEVECFNVAYDSDHVSCIEWHPGALAFHPKGSRVYSRNNNDNNTVFVALTLGDALSARLRDEQVCVHNAGSFTTLSTPETRMLVQSAQRTLQAAQWRTPLFVESLATLAIATLDSLHNDAAKVNYEGATPGRVDAMKLLLDYIEAHLQRDLSLVELADVAQTEVALLTRQFKAAVGLPLNQYILMRRLERAKHSLVQGECLHKIAERYGFGDKTAFCQLFTRWIGVPPQRYSADMD